MKRWEKFLFVWLVLVILVVFWYGMKVATQNINRTFGKDVLVTKSIDSGGRVSKED